MKTQLSQHASSFALSWPVSSQERVPQQWNGSRESSNWISHLSAVLEDTPSPGTPFFFKAHTSFLIWFIYLTYRTHRGKERFPGMTITYALMEKYEEIATKEPEKARLFTKARVTRLLRDNNGVINGVEYEKDGQTFTEHGAVIIATGGYGADFSDDSLLKKYRPDLLHLPTTNGDHCTGDGVKLALEVGANPADLEWVQVHPTGLVDPKEPDAKLKVYIPPLPLPSSLHIINDDKERGI